MGFGTGGGGNNCVKVGHVDSDAGGGIFGWEPGNEYAGPRNRARNYGFGALKISDLSVAWQTPIPLPEENVQAGHPEYDHQPQYYCTPPVITDSKNGGLIAGVFSGGYKTYGIGGKVVNHLYLYRIDPVTGNQLDSLNVSDVPDSDPRFVNPRFNIGDDLIAGIDGNLYWLEFPTFTQHIQALTQDLTNTPLPCPFNVSQVWSTKLKP